MYDVDGEKYGWCEVDSNNIVLNIVSAEREWALARGYKEGYDGVIIGEAYNPPYIKSKDEKLDEIILWYYGDNGYGAASTLETLEIACSNLRMQIELLKDFVNYPRDIVE